MNLLATKWGRMVAFFFLYMAEGIPQGFAGTAVAAQMRRAGVSPGDVSRFVGRLYLPWSFKFLYGPVVDVVSSDRFGRRRMWIFLAQVMMVVTLLAAAPIDFAKQFALFTLVIVIHNVFASTQDVAIDALAVGTLPEEERGLVNGLMFAGAYVGIAIGGAGVLFLTRWVAFSHTFFYVCGALLAITVFVVVPLKEPKRADTAPRLSLREVSSQVGGFMKEAGRSMFGSRAAWLVVLLALLPAGPYALGLALQSNLAVELGFDDNAVGKLSLWSSILSAGGCLLGGLLSDRFGRRKMLGLYIAAMAFPTLYMAWALSHHHWVMPGGGGAAVPAQLVRALWIAILSYSVFNGLMYGTRTALFMDLTNPAVAATQFTSYMALLNLVIWYTGEWQGTVIDRWGYPTTLLVDAVAGLLCIAVLPFLRRQQAPPALPAAA